MDLSKQKNFVIQDCHNATGNIICNEFWSVLSGGEGLINPSPFGITIFRYKHGQTSQEDELAFFKAVDRAVGLDGIIVMGSAADRMYVDGSSRGAWLAHEMKKYKPSIQTVLSDYQLNMHPERWLVNPDGGVLEPFKNSAQVIATSAGTRVEIANPMIFPDDEDADPIEVPPTVLSSPYHAANGLDVIVSDDNLVRKGMGLDESTIPRKLSHEFCMQAKREYFTKFPALKVIDDLIAEKMTHAGGYIATAEDFNGLNFNCA